MFRDQPPIRVLFVSRSNSARSQMAEAILNRWSDGRFVAASSGPCPTGVVHPMAATVLKQMGFDPGKFRSKNWTRFQGDGAQAFDIIVMLADRHEDVGFGVWPGNPVIVRWDMPDPECLDAPERDRLFGFWDVYRRLVRRVQNLINVPVENLGPAILAGACTAAGASRHGVA